MFDSRSTAFGAAILDVTDGAGIDVVLNSLTGEGFIEASLACLAQGGRFVELARRDILSEDEMAALRPDVAYSIFDLYTLKQQDPARPGAALKGVLARISTGELAPLMHTRWPLAETSSAMGFMRAARHIGKVVLTAPPLRTGRLRQDRTYLVTGGLGGIGCALAEWLAEHDAGTIVLNGRRAPAPEAQAAIDALRNRGFRVEVELADVTDAAQVDAMLARMNGTLPPLAGVIHSVGVLSDAALANQSWESFETVLWPKMLGAWHLHRATAGRDLDLFVLFSSVAGVLGNPGQANHAAANAFLDQLAAHRRATGAPGAGDCLGRLVGGGRGGRAAGADRRAAAGIPAPAGSHRSRASRHSSACCGRMPRPPSCWQRIGRCSARPSGAAFRSSRPCCPPRRRTMTSRLRRKTCLPSSRQRQSRRARTCWSRSCSGKCRRC